MPRDLAFTPTDHPPAPPLAVAAIDALRTAVTSPPSDSGIIIEERSIWQPASWLIQCCWQALADSSASDETQTVVRQAEARNPTAPAQALYRLARQPQTSGGSTTGVARWLPRLEQTLLNSAGDIHTSEALLYAASAAALSGNPLLAVSFLERLDQLPKAWDRIFANPELRNLLAELSAQLAPHPLIHALISASLRRFGDAGAYYLQEVAAFASQHPLASQHSSHAATHNLSNTTKSPSLLQRCVNVLQYGMLTTPLSQRISITVLGRAGLVQDVLQHLGTLANILEARRASGLDRQGDQNLIRQVKRSASNPEVDFQVFALTEAIHAMPMRHVSRDDRVALANRLALLAVRSDGWTAASAVGTLVELGAVKFAIETVAKIHPRDPTRTEAVISLVRALLTAGDAKTASEQVQKGLEWARSITSHSRERALIRGLGEVYLQANQPETTLKLLDEWREPTGWQQRWRKLFGKQWDDDDLRNQALRLRALLHPDVRRAPNRPATPPKAIEALVADLRKWGPQLLEGEALVNFYAESLLRPLLASQRLDLAWRILPEVQTLLALSVGDKHAARVGEIAELLAEHLLIDQALGTRSLDLLPEAEIGKFLRGLWQADAKRGVWQIVHGIEGSLPLLLALEGPPAVVAIAQAAPAIVGSDQPQSAIDVGEE